MGEEILVRHSKLNMASYGCSKFLTEFMEMAFTAWLYYFYVRTIGVDSLIIGIAFVIYAIWNAVNDPLVGYLMDKFKMPWEDKWGMRYPWVAFGAIPWLFSYLAIFLVPLTWDPVADQMLIFGWALFSICL